MPYKYFIKVTQVYYEGDDMYHDPNSVEQDIIDTEISEEFCDKIAEKYYNGEFDNYCCWED